MKERAYQLYLLGFPIRKIAEALGVSASTVSRWIVGVKKSRRGRPKKSIELPKDIKERLKTLLLSVREEKGKTRVTSLRRIYGLLELDLKIVGINSLQSFYRFANQFIKEEFKGLEELEKKRRPAKEHSKFAVSKGSIQREKGVVEIDATGYTLQGKQYSIMLAMEVYSGKVLSYWLVENKEKSATHYNKAFNSLEVAKFMVHLFEGYGLPVKVKTDNEKILTSELITQGLEILGIEIKRTKGYRPNQKLIERTIRELKDIMRTLNIPDIDELVKEAINIYNRTEHRFKHFSHPVVPNEVFVSQVEEVFREVGYDTIRRAFREKFTRTVVNNTIQIENLRYEFILPVESSELGRKRKSPQVTCYRDIQNNTYLEVYSMEGRYLGRAQLISTEVASTDTSEWKQAKKAEKRAERRERKLREELQAIEALRYAEEDQDFDLSEILSGTQRKEREEVKEDDFDLLEVLSKAPKQKRAEEEGGEIDPLQIWSRRRSHE